MALEVKIQKREFDDTCTTSRNLIQAGMTKPWIREVMEYAEPRMYTTLIVSGAKSPYDLNSNRTPTKIRPVPKGMKTGTTGIRYKKMGHIMISSTILAQVGTSDPDGHFRLRMKTNYIVPGMNVVFHDKNFQARAQGLPTGTPGNYIYLFRANRYGDVFNYNTHVAPQMGEKTCFGMFTSYGEQSLRGYGRSHYPKEFINHMGMQRKAIGMSGDALAEGVLWVSANKTKGWWPIRLQQARLQFLMEDEYNKLWAISSMKDDQGNLLDQPWQTDPDTGNPLYIGDGIYEQIRGGNEAWGSGPTGMATIDDFKDVMKYLSRKSTSITGKHWYAITGEEGYDNATEILMDYFVNHGGQMMTDKAGNGDTLSVGGNFDTIKYLGNLITFVKHDMFDNEQAFTQVATDGTGLQSGEYLIIERSGQTGNDNAEIYCKDNNGVNRSMWYAHLQGFTGESGQPLHSVDASTYEMAKQDGLILWNTESCAIIRRNYTI